MLLSGGKGFEERASRDYNDIEYPDDCIVDFDMRLIDLFMELDKAKSMPNKFLKASGKGFFIEKEGYALAITEDLEDVIGSEAFKKQMKDILEYRTMEYYRRRYAREM